MPRPARISCSSEYMHIIIRGIGRQLIFEDKYDYEYFLSLLKRFCMETGVRVCAYCLMDNHVHFLVRDRTNNISLFMKKLGVSYCGYFNNKYDRVGHLFQDRFKSEPIKDDAYLFNVFRYILQNPKKAGICKASEYAWSSYWVYDSVPDFMDISIIKARIGSKKEYKAFIESDVDEKCLEYETVKHDDAWALNELRQCLGITNGFELQSYDKNSRNEALNKLKDRGMSIRQIERLTGIGRNIIQRVTLSQSEPSPLTDLHNAV